MTVEGERRVIDRHLWPVVTQRHASVPVLVLNGPRTVGKSTLLAACAKAHDVLVTDLDDLPTRRSVSDDPSYFAASPSRPVCIDEYQYVPPLLDAIKAELNQDTRPGRYVLTGSTRYDSLPRVSQSLAGRAHVMTLWPLSQGELTGRKETFLDMLLSDARDLMSHEPSTTSREAYEEAVLAGGFPMPRLLKEAADKRRWFYDYVNTVIDRDALEIRRVRQRRVLPLVLRHLAARTASIMQATDIARRVELDARLVADYVTLLESVFLVHRIDAFGRTLSARVGKAPKLHMVDTGLAGQLLGVTPHKLASRDPSTLTEFGHLVETFAVNELVKQSGWAEAHVDLSHFRTKDQHEVDLVVESDDGRIAGIEVKAKGSVTDKDFRGLKLLRDRLGTSFVAGVVVNLGTRSYRYDERLYVVPLDRLWMPAP
ncbi:ATP-binding protein [Solicola gregarius]|uniref:ATP-binding protein n=1 Tax=Solicola gregarius TaxID=2908642 RepID=A0AA46TH11_9ACTN|nr:ATP-binding protein [Solicola gregarius]UYM04373.1 ATP-binding protein [Solicola gregarius]